MAPSIRSALGALIIVIVAAGCSSGETSVEDATPAGIRVAAFDFPESVVLAELYALVIESAGVPVVRLGSVGPREIVDPAIELGRIDIVPEYLGTALRWAGSTETQPDPASARDELNELLDSRGLLALEASAAQDTNVIVVTAEMAEREQLENISDLARVSELRFGGPVECPARPQCLPGLESVYGLQFVDFVPQQSLAFTAEALHRSEIDVGLLFSTASELDASDLVVLVDDRQLQPAENIVPLVRSEALELWGPEVAEALDAMSTRLTTDDLRALNVRLANGEDVEEIAESWLVSQGLLRSG